MKLRKSSIFIISLGLLLLFSYTACSESEETGDLWHWSDDGTQWSWSEYSEEKPNIDIVDVTAEKSGTEVTLSMTVDGPIQTTSNYRYTIYYGNPDGAHYFILYTLGMGLWGSECIEGAGAGFLSNPISDDGSTLSATITLVEDVEFEVYGNAIEYTDASDTETSEWWQDWYPNTHFQGDTSDQDDTDDDTSEDDTSEDEDTDDDTSDDTSEDDDSDGETSDEDEEVILPVNGNTTTNDNTTGTSDRTPGFETLATIAALGVAFIILRRKK